MRKSRKGEKIERMKRESKKMGGERGRGLEAREKRVREEKEE